MVSEIDKESSLRLVKQTNNLQGRSIDRAGMNVSDGKTCASSQIVLIIRGYSSI